MVPRFNYLWHGRCCRVLARAPFRRGIKRNALVLLEDGEKMIVPWRALRRPPSA